MRHTVGRRVVALVPFADEDSSGRRYTHAIPGDLGSIIAVVDDLTPTVQWDRTGTLCDCASYEIQTLTRRVIPRG